MKKIIIAVVSIVVVFGLYFLFADKNEVELIEENIASYISPELGFSFKYKIGQDGYEIQEVYVDGSVDFLHSIVLVKTKDFEREIPVGGEGPATITITVFKNLKKQSPQVWADKHIQYSNINLKTSDVTETVVGGANAIRYMADGLYASENVIVAHGDNVYVITGMFTDLESSLRKDFAPLVESVKFIPTLEQI